MRMSLGLGFAMKYSMVRGSILSQAIDHDLSFLVMKTALPQYVVDVLMVCAARAVWR